MSAPQLSNTRFYTKFASIECREALNAVAISNSGTMFATGGDDEQVTLWEINETFSTVSQRDVIASGFGRVTSLLFTEVALSELRSPLDTSTLLFIGTAEGWVVVAREIKHSHKFVLVSTSNLAEVVEPKIPHPGGRYPVTATRYDRTFRLLVVGTEAGSVLLFHALQGSVEFKLIYQFQLNDCVVDLHFVGETHFLVYTLRAGVHCRLDLRKIREGLSSVRWMRSLDGFIGSAAVSSTGDLHLVHNLSTGCFELLQLQDDTKLYSIPVFTRTNCIKPCTFSEDDRVAILGGEDGTVRVMDVRTGYLMQTIDHEVLNSARVQALDVGRSTHRFVLVVASTTSPRISVWTKNKHASQVDPDSSETPLAAISFRQWELCVSLILIILSMYVCLRA